VSIKAAANALPIPRILISYAEPACGSGYVRILPDESPFSNQPGVRRVRHAKALTAKAISRNLPRIVRV
jgi:hypothetical protein